MLSSASQTIASRAPLAAPARRPASAARGRAPLRTQALFSFLSPPKAKAGPGKAQELVDRLLELTERTNGGLNASPAKRDEIAGLVDELEGYCPRAPMRSPLIFGDYEVGWCGWRGTGGGMDGCAGCGAQLHAFRRPASPCPPGRSSPPASPRQPGAACLHTVVASMCRANPSNPTFHRPSTSPGALRLQAPERGRTFPLASGPGGVPWPARAAVDPGAKRVHQRGETARRSGGCLAAQRCAARRGATGMVARCAA